MDDIDGWPTLGSAVSFNPFDGLAAIEDLDVGMGASTWLFNDLGLPSAGMHGGAGQLPSLEVEVEESLGSGPSAAIRPVPISAARKKRKARELLGCGGKTADPNSVDVKINANIIPTVEIETTPTSAAPAAISGYPNMFTGTAPAAKDCKRRKVCQACILCRKAHMSCDDVRPCTRCTKRGLAHLCQDAPKKGEMQSKVYSPGPISILPRPIRSAEFRLAPSPLVADSPLASIGPALASALPFASPSPLAQPSHTPEPSNDSPHRDIPAPLLKSDSNPGFAGPADSHPPAPAPKNGKSNLVGSVASSPFPAPLPATLLAFAPQSSTVSPPRHTTAPVPFPSPASPITFNPSSSGHRKLQHDAAHLQQSHFKDVQPDVASDISHPALGGGQNDHSTNSRTLPIGSAPLKTPGVLFTPAITDALAEQYMSLQQLPCGPSFPILPNPLLSTTQQLFASKAVGLEYAAIADLWSAALGKSEEACNGMAGRCNTCPYNSLEQFFLMAAGENNAGEASLGDRLQEVIRAKWRAGLLKPYNYGQGYARLAKYLENGVTSLGRQRILSVIAVFQTGFAQLARNLTDMDLAAVEEQFEKLCLEYDWVFSAQGVPAALWRRTGEIYKANAAFARLVGLPLELFEGGRVCIYELMTEDSAISYWERYGQLAFDPDQKASMSLCTLRNPGKPEVAPIQCTYSFTIRRDGVGIPLSIAGNFLPAQSAPVRPRCEIPEWVIAGMAAASLGTQASPATQPSQTRGPTSKHHFHMGPPPHQPFHAFSPELHQRQSAHSSHNPSIMHTRPNPHSMLSPAGSSPLHRTPESPDIRRDNLLNPAHAGIGSSLSGYAVQAIEEFLSTASTSVVAAEGLQTAL
ncbi:hypothetical protein HK097_007054 [Rhizophlyctis rosea]|uniref:Zn(2)-C6 fungal-type domain-containing protein n=1 Tax=Rhizophlyctis rosea TaxID=64517 RepID=A0AAD5SC57_9FUNG|nr:hypothetical protein HK097_007054 [Rhizophlyctis rosea]